MADKLIIPAISNIAGAIIPTTTIPILSSQ